MSKALLFVDDEKQILKAIRRLFLDTDYTLYTAGSGEEALRILEKAKIDLIVADIRMPVMDGVLGTKLIKSHFKDVKVVILTTFKDDEYIKEALKTGAEGYILKNQPVDSIMESLRAVSKGNIVLEREVANTLSAMLKEGKKVRPEQLDISQRELEILKLVGEGLSNREIAKKLYLSEGTARNYVTGLLEKLGLRDRTQLAIFYIRNWE